MQKEAQLTKVFWVAHFWPFAGVAVVLMLLFPVIFGVKNGTYEQSAYLFQHFFPLIGLLLFIPLFSPDDQKISAVLRTKKTPYAEIFLVRLVSILVFLGCLIIGLLELFQLQNAAIAFMPFLITGFSDALFLGGLFSIGYLLSQQVIVALMFPLFYYIICLFTGDHYLKSFYLFTLGTPIKDHKLLLLLVGILLIGGSILYQGRMNSIDNFLNRSAK